MYRVHVEWLDGETVDFDDVESADLSRSGTVLDMRRRVRVDTGPMSYTTKDVEHGVPLAAVRWWMKESR